MSEFNCITQRRKILKNKKIILKGKEGVSAPCLKDLKKIINRLKKDKAEIFFLDFEIGTGGTGRNIAIFLSTTKNNYLIQAGLAYGYSDNNGEGTRTLKECINYLIEKGYNSYKHCKINKEQYLKIKSDKLNVSNLQKADYYNKNKIFEVFQLWETRPL